MKAVAINKGKGSIQITGLTGENRINLNTGKDAESLNQRISLLEDIIKSKDEQILMLKDLLRKKRRNE